MIKKKEEKDEYQYMEMNSHIKIDILLKSQPPRAYGHMDLKNQQLIGQMSTHDDQ